jgi:hypothetical protein
VPQWILPTLSEILLLNDPAWSEQNVPVESPVFSNQTDALQQIRAEREWSAAIAALSSMLQQRLRSDDRARSPKIQGFVLSAPLPILSHPDLVDHLATRTLAVGSLHAPAWMPLQLLPVAETEATTPGLPPSVLPLLPGDPLATEQFCLVFTPWLSLVMVLGTGLTGAAFMFSFLPEVVEQAWQAIRPRILLMSAHQLEPLDQWVEQFAPIAPDYQTVMTFNRLLLQHLLDGEEDAERDRQETRRKRGKPAQPAVTSSEPIDSASFNPQAADVELLQAIAHEVRTPLTTIRTLTRSLLRRTDLSPDVIKRLEMINRECDQQIDRFGLIFRAVELETNAIPDRMRSLTRTPLGAVLHQSIPRWQQQASQRNLTLDVVLPQAMPAVVSDPDLLDKALTSLIERFTRSLPIGSHIQVEVVLAGDQLKLQLQSQPPQTDCAINPHPIPGQASKRTPLKSLGQLLMFQPETGSLSLNLAVTKNLFQAVGGKLIVRQRPHQGEVMTVFLPLEATDRLPKFGDSTVLEV